MDRRVRKTREAIIAAFVELIEEKSFEQITINEIAERADVNRGTVYLHYVDKFDLLDQCVEIYLLQLFESCLGAERERSLSRAAMLQAFEYLEQHASIYAALMVNKGALAFRKCLMDLITQSIGEQIDACELNYDVNKEVLIQFLSSAIVGVLEWWINRAMPYPAEEVVEQLWLLLKHIQILPQPSINGSK